MPQPYPYDMSGKTCVITGATAGLGKVATHALAGMGATVVMGCRDEAKANRVREEIAATTGNPKVEVALVSLGEPEDVRRFAEELKSRHPAIDVLINNAATWLNRQQRNSQGVDLTWSTNVLAYHLLTSLLMEPLANAHAQSDARAQSGTHAQGGTSARIINVASTLARDLDETDLAYQRRPYKGADAYAQSKQANRMLTWALSRSLDGNGITANALHPGLVNTELFIKSGGWKSRLTAIAVRLMGRKPQQGADTLIWLAASPEVEGVNGKFWKDRRVITCQHRDPARENALKALCDQMCGLGG